MIKKRVTIGCDPEFVIVVSDREGEEVLCPENIGYGRGQPFGGDGIIFELRPGYSNNIPQIIHSIKNLLKEGNNSLRKLENTTWLCGHFQYGRAIGGHIHIGGLHLNQREDIMKPFIEDLKYALIEGVSQIVDPKDQIKERRDQGYGRPDAWRRQRPMYSMYKPINRIEYRAPGSFIISPKITFLNLMVAKVVGMLATSYGPGIITSFYDKSVNPLPRKILEFIVYELETDPIFKEEKDRDLGIEILKEYTKKVKPVDWNVDFRKNWGIV